MKRAHFIIRHILGILLIDTYVLSYFTTRFYHLLHYSNYHQHNNYGIYYARTVTIAKQIHKIL